MSSETELTERLRGLKRSFVGPFFTVNALAALDAARRVRHGEPGRAAWAAGALTHAAVVAHAPRGWPRPQSGPASMLGVALVGTAATASLPRSRTATVRAGALALGGAATYLGWYASFGRTPSPALRIGCALPSFTVRVHDGSELDSRALSGKPAALFFTRGNWCPFCTAQVQSLVADYGRLADRGVQVVVVSSHPEEDSRALAERFGVDIVWATDPGLAAAATLGIVDPDGVPVGIPPTYGRDTIMPTLVVIDPQQRVIGAEQTDNFRIRPDAGTVLRILDATAPGAAAAAPALEVLA